jgi:hypothetical protein
MAVGISIALKPLRRDTSMVPSSLARIGIYCKLVDEVVEGIDAYPEGLGKMCRAGLMDRGTDCARHGLRIKLRRSDIGSRLIAILLVCAAILQPNALSADADTVPVRHTEGLMHGFLVLRTLEGKALADGQLTQDAQGDRVTAQLIFRFKDGSTYVSKMDRPMRRRPYSLSTAHSDS